MKKLLICLVLLFVPISLLAGEKVAKTQELLYSYMLADRAKLVVAYGVADGSSHREITLFEVPEDIAIPNSRGTIIKAGLYRCGRWLSHKLDSLGGRCRYVVAQAKP